MKQTYTHNQNSELLLTRHAVVQMSKRSLSINAVDAVLNYGRTANVRGAAIYAIGRKEVELFASAGVDLAPYQGIQVVCSLSDGAVITAYRNQNFRSLRSRRLRR